LRAATAADHTFRAGLRRYIAQGPAEGTAVVISLTVPVNELWVRRALTGASRYASFPYSESTIARLERAVTELMGVVGPVDE
jgi:hypothetical protein